MYDLPVVGVELHSQILGYKIMLIFLAKCNTFTKKFRELFGPIVIQPFTYEIWFKRLKKKERLCQAKFRWNMLVANIP
jgi:hypothetical protein